MNNSLDNTPNHVAIIMDGNGRWAKLKGKSRLFGHKNGIKSVQKIVEYATKIEIKNLTLYAFSTRSRTTTLVAPPPKVKVTSYLRANLHLVKTLHTCISPIFV